MVTASQQRSEDKREARPLWNMVSKVASVLLGTTIIAVCTYLLGVGSSVRDLRLDMDYVRSPINGSLPRTIMIQNTRAIGWIQDSIKEIKKDDERLEEYTKKIHNEYHVEMTQLRESVAQVRERCARLTGQR